MEIGSMKIESLAIQNWDPTLMKVIEIGVQKSRM